MVSIYVKSHAGFISSTESTVVHLKIAQSRSSSEAIGPKVDIIGILGALPCKWSEDSTQSQDQLRGVGPSSTRPAAVPGHPLLSGLHLPKQRQGRGMRVHLDDSRRCVCMCIYIYIHIHICMFIGWLFRNLQEPGTLALNRKEQACFCFCFVPSASI